MLTTAVAAFAGAAIILGVGLLKDRAAAVPEPEAAAPVPVRVATLHLDNGYTVPRRFVGQIEPGADVALSFELSGRLDILLVEEGEAVEQGQVLARLDTDLLKAEEARLEAARAASVAQLVFAESRLARAMQLKKQGFTSQETLDQAQAARDELSNRIAEIDAALRSVSINLEKSIMIAPVSGQIATQTAETGETIQAGKQIVSLMETTRPELRVGLPLDVAAERLQAVQVELSGGKTPATLKRLRPDIDPVTRTRTALFTLPAGTGALFGQTAALTLDTFVEQQGAWVPLDALQSGKGSVWTVLAVVDDRLRRATVELLHVDGDRAYVHGSFEDGAEIVISGAHRVVPGQTVAAIRDEG
jgi:RND family efflux transporter MFP subunit